MAKRFKLKDYSALTQEFGQATDRAVAILGGAYVEEALLDALLYWLGFRNLDYSPMPKAIEEMLGNGAPLGTFSNKIMMAEALKLIGPRTRRDLDLIRKIRNLCAHSVNPTEFAEAPLRDWSASLSERKLPIANSVAFLPPASEPRKRFEECCHQLYDQLYNDDRSLAPSLEDVVGGFEMD